MNARLIIILFALAAVISSALGVVYSLDQSRQFAVRLGELEDQRDDYVAEWSRLQLEQAWLADASNIESKARDQLRMHSPDQNLILVVRP